ncbi:hypothetical protein [Enhygromyxa salina]|uniref:FG-GAP repeat protein n=1 Tax=Enhygromyxa salina TaxID=215803 RepID=A0A2S9YSP1_9BACT|nr:hypothetical protein [Enhygromyxa salina]PRQ08103.1 hypothetical protein ENSA7_20750 [Enhygromyxa salina]
MQEYLGVAVVSYTDPKQPRFERVRVLNSGCEPEDFGNCGEPSTDSPEGGGGWSEIGQIAVERLDVADVDGDGIPEIVLETSHVTMHANYEDFDEPSDDVRPYYQESYAQRRFTVMRPNLSLQLDAVVHQEMLETIYGMHATRDIDGEDVRLTPEGVLVTWCEIDMNAGYNIRKCLEQACTPPTTRIQMSYDPGTDTYGEATIEQLRPEVAYCDDKP